MSTSFTCVPCAQLWFSVDQRKDKTNTANVLIAHRKHVSKGNNVLYCNTHHKASNTKQSETWSITLPGISLLSDDGLKSASMHYKQNTNAVYIQARREDSLNRWWVCTGFRLCIVLRVPFSPCDGREGCPPRLGLLGAAGSPWVGEGQGLLRGEGRGEDPGPVPAPGCKCWGRISSTSSSTSPGRRNESVIISPAFHTTVAK